jgi:hypothetical protein
MMPKSIQNAANYRKNSRNEGLGILVYAIDLKCTSALLWPLRLANFEKIPIFPIFLGISQFETGSHRLRVPPTLSITVLIYLCNLAMALARPTKSLTKTARIAADNFGQRRIQNCVRSAKMAAAFPSRPDRGRRAPRPSVLAALRTNHWRPRDRCRIRACGRLAFRANSRQKLLRPLVWLQIPNVLIGPRPQDAWHLSRYRFGGSWPKSQRSMSANYHNTGSRTPSPAAPRISRVGPAHHHCIPISRTDDRIAALPAR